MKRNIVFAPPAWEDFQFFRGNGRKTCKRIMDMASVELGGYELRYDTGSVYVTKNFFALLGLSLIHI